MERRVESWTAPREDHAGRWKEVVLREELTGVCEALRALLWINFTWTMCESEGVQRSVSVGASGNFSCDSSRFSRGSYHTQRANSPRARISLSRAWPACCADA